MDFLYFIIFLVVQESVSYSTKQFLSIINYRLIYYGYVLITGIFLERVLSAALTPLNDYVFSAMK